jgi:hypothetical protein
MKTLLKLACLVLATAGIACTAGAVTLTFDDLATPFDGYEYRAPMASYGGLQWSNFYVFDVVDTVNYHMSGYPNALVSPKNIALNWFGNPAALSSATPFSLDSAYLTAAWNDGLQVEVKGFSGATLAYDNTYTINTAGPSLINFNYLDVTEVEFISFGGTPHAGYSGAGTHFSMDNLTVTIVPECSTFALAGLGTGMLMIRRRPR